MKIKDLSVETQGRILAGIQNVKAYSGITANKNLYYNAEKKVEALTEDVNQWIRGLAIPIGWCKKAVDTLSDYIRFDGIVDERGDDTTIEEILTAENFTEKVKKALHSSLVSGVSFIIAIPDEDTGVKIYVKSSEDAYAHLSPVTNKIDFGLSVIERDEKTGEIRKCNLFEEDRILTITPNTEEVTIHQTNLDECSIYPISYMPTLYQPLGRSRISRSLMGMVDGAMRTLIRAELGGEFYSLPQIYVLFGAAETKTSAKTQLDNLKTRVHSIWGLTADNQGNQPTVGQLSQQSPAPHLEYIRMYANQAAAEAQIPVSEFGFPSDNPPSDASIYAQRLPMIRSAETAITYYETQIKKIASSIFNILREDVKSAAPVFEPCYQMSPSASADVLSKVAQVAPEIVQTDYFYRMLGLNRKDMAMIKRQAVDAKNDVILDEILNEKDVSTEAGDESTAGDDNSFLNVSEMKANKR